jgi:hypothetical protein
MDPQRPQDPNERPSIFSRAEEDEDLRPAAAPRRPEPPDWHDASTRAHATVRDEAPIRPTERPATGPRVVLAQSEEPMEAEHRRSLSRRQKLALAGTGLAGLVVVGFVVGMLTRSPTIDPALAGASASPTLSPTPSATVEPSATPEPTAAATPSATVSQSPTPIATQVPTPVPTPVGPPQELARGGWATVAVGELNVRREPGLNATLEYRLVRGAVVHLRDEQPVDRDGLLWYRVRSLGGADGWSASGPQSSPFLTMLVADAYLLHCGLVEGAVFEVVEGTLSPRDPIRFAGIALPGSGLSDPLLALMELVRGIRGEMCIGVSVAADGSISVASSSSVWACGKPQIAGGIRRIAPAPDVDAAPDIRIKESAFVHPQVVTSQTGNEDVTRNMRAAFQLIAADPDATGCVEFRPLNPSSGDHYQSVYAEQCVVVEEWDGQVMRLRPARADTVVTFRRPTDVQGSIPVGVPIAMGYYMAQDSHGAYANIHTRDRQPCAA